ncbi:MAG: hypothetical protein HXS48_20720 [Theionarchaea archaeon]|nr:MAG: hypothetical protein AYK19_10560 [Theionarchaea archaeon DG-70-1]MBU7029371.1 hypothetical protein [Theionarchaea archaeon]
MKRIMAVVLLLTFSLQSVVHVPAQAFTLDIWIDRGCGAEYHVGDMLKVHWEVSHPCEITVWEIKPDGYKRKLTSQPIISIQGGHGSSGWTIREEHGYGRRAIYAQATSQYGSDSDECEFYVVEEEPPDADGDGVTDDQDNCYNPDCHIVDSKGCPEDSDNDGVNDCDDDCPYDKGSSSNDGCPESPSDRDNDGVTDDQDNCYNPGCSIVDSRGCPKDSDSDGLDDCEDDCPTEYGEKSNDGCPTTSTTSTPSTPASPTTPESSDLPLLLILLPVIAIPAIGVPLLLRRRQGGRTVPSDRTRIYDDDTRIY